MDNKIGIDFKLIKNRSVDKLISTSSGSINPNSIEFYNQGENSIMKIGISGIYMKIYPRQSKVFSAEYICQYQQSFEVDFMQKDLRQIKDEPLEQNEILHQGLLIRQFIKKSKHC